MKFSDFLTSRTFPVGNGILFNHESPRRGETLLTRHEVRTVFRRREAEGVLPSGEAAALYDELTADIAAADIVIQPDTADMEREFGAVLEACFSQTPPTFIRTNDALHLASAKVAGEPEFITADIRQKAGHD